MMRMCDLLEMTEKNSRIVVRGRLAGSQSAQKMRRKNDVESLRKDIYSRMG